MAGERFSSFEALQNALIESEGDSVGGGSSSESVPKVEIAIDERKYSIKELYRLLYDERISLYGRIGRDIAAERGLDSSKIDEIKTLFDSIKGKTRAATKYAKDKRPYNVLQKEITDAVTRALVVAKELRASDRGEQSQGIVPEGEATLHEPIHPVNSDPGETERPKRSRTEEDTRTIEQGSVYVYSDTNSLAELNDLSKLTSAGLDQILAAKNGFTIFKRRLTKEMTEALAGIPQQVARKNKLYFPAFAKASELKIRIAGHLTQGHEHYRDAVRADIEEYLKTLKSLRANVEALSDPLRAELSEKTTERVPPQSKLPAAPVEAAPAVPPEAQPATQKTPEARSEAISFVDARKRVDAAAARVAAAAVKNPMALVTAPNGAYTKEYKPLLDATEKMLSEATKRAEAGADPDLEADQLLTDNIAQLESLASRIADFLNGKASNDTAAPEVVAVEAVDTPQGGAERNAPERTSELAALTQKYDTYKGAKEAYEKAIDAHYGAYRSNTGSLWERGRRGVGKLFGIGPKHTPELDALYKTMNDARVDFSRSRFEAMDARIKARIAQNPKLATATWSGREGGYKNLAEWNDRLKRREITRTIQRSSEGFIQRQYDAFTPAQRSAVDAIRGKTEGEMRKDERWMMYKQVAVGAVSGALMVWKTKTAIATGGISLLAGAVGVATGNTLGNGVEWWKNRRIGRLKQDLEHVSETRGDSVDFDTAADYDATLRDYGKKIIATEESRDAQVKAARIAGAVAGGLAIGSIADMSTVGDHFTAGSKSIDDQIAPTTDPTAKGSMDQLPKTDHGPGTGLDANDPRMQKGDTAIDSGKTDDRILPTPDQSGKGGAVESGPVFGTDEKPSDVEPAGKDSSAHSSEPNSSELPDKIMTHTGDTLHDIHEKAVSDMFDSQRDLDQYLKDRYNLTDGTMRGGSENAVELRERIGWSRADTNIDLIHPEGDGHPQDVFSREGMREDAREWLAQHGHPADASPQNEPGIDGSKAGDTPGGAHESNTDLPQQSDTPKTEAPSEEPSIEQRVRELNDPSIMTLDEAHKEVAISSTDITNERSKLYSILHDAPQNSGFFASLFGNQTLPAHEFLANQSLADVSKLSAQRPEYIALVASQNNVDSTALQNWMHYMKQLAPDIANRSPQMTVGAYVNDNVLPELAKHSKQAA